MLGIIGAPDEKAVPVLKKLENFFHVCKLFTLIYSTPEKRSFVLYHHFIVLNKIHLHGAYLTPEMSNNILAF